MSVSCLSELMHRSKSRLHSITSSANGEQRRRHFEAERLGGLEVDHQFELGRLYDREVGGLLAFENPAGVNTDQTVRIHKASSIADEAANRGGIAKLVDRGNGMACRQGAKLQPHCARAIRRSAFKVEHCS